MKRLLFLAGCIALASLFLSACGNASEGVRQETSAPSSAGDDAFAAAFSEHRGNFAAEGSGTVTRVLADDNDGSRHQRFIVSLGSGQTLLIAHNIDLAPRVEALSVGDTIAFKGEYEWSDKGGTVHWTHHDPAGSHQAGWIRHKGKTYQ